MLNCVSSTCWELFQVSLGVGSTAISGVITALDCKATAFTSDISTHAHIWYSLILHFTWLHCQVQGVKDTIKTMTATGPYVPTTADRITAQNDTYLGSQAQVQEQIMK